MDYIHEWPKRTTVSDYGNLRCVRCGLCIAQVESKLRTSEEFKPLESLYVNELEKLEKQYRNKAFNKFKEQREKLFDKAESQIQELINTIEPCLTDKEAAIKDVIE